MGQKQIKILEELLLQLEAELAASSDKVESSDSTPTTPTSPLGWDWVEV